MLLDSTSYTTLSNKKVASLIRSTVSPSFTLRWRVHINIHIIHKLIIYSVLLFVISGKQRIQRSWRSCWRITRYLSLYQGSNEEPWVAGCQIIALQKRAKYKRQLRLISTCCTGSIYSLACLFCSPLRTIVQSRFLGFRLQVAKTKKTYAHARISSFVSLFSKRNCKKGSERLWTVYNCLKWRWIRFDT